MEDAISAVRRFNRFFTKFVGALDANFLETGMSLAEARILFEIEQREPCAAIDIQEALELDPGFVSRVLARFEARDWVTRAREAEDGRRRSVALAPEGRKMFRLLDERQRREVETLLTGLDDGRRHRLVSALAATEAILSGDTSEGFSLRHFRPGDMGLLVSRQAVLYTEVYGWNSNIEVNESEVTSAFLKNFKPGREQCWIAEVDGEMAGSILLTDEGNGLSRLRLLYVEPRFQGRGIGDALVTACIGFAKSVGYSRMVLWTHSILHGARRIYARHGFTIASTAEHSRFGPVLMGEIWELQL